MQSVILNPEVEPISLAEAKAHMVVEYGNDDALISSLITAAREYVQEVQWRSLIKQTRELQLAAFGNRAIPLSYGPVQEITSIKYIDVNGTEQTLSADTYYLDAVNEQVVLAYQKDWPSTRYQPDAVKIRYICGYGDAGSDVPESTRAAIKLLVGHWYANREAASPVNLKDIPIGVDNLLQVNSMRV